MAKKRNPGVKLSDVLIIGGIGFLAFKSGILKNLGFSGTVGGVPIGGGVGGGGTSGGATGGGVTAAQKQAWASSIGLPVCVADAFVAQYSRLPASLSELDAWGASTGRRSATGAWSC